MIIKRLEQSDRDLYNVCAKEYGTIFDTLDWLDLFNGKVYVYGIYNKGNKIIGGFHLYYVKKLGFSLFRNPPFTPTIGPFLNMDAKHPAKIMDKWKDVLSLMADFVEKLPYSVVSFALGSHIIDTQPFIWKKFKVTPAYTYIFNLNKTHDVLWEELSKRHRHDLTKARKDGLIVKQIDDMNIVKKLVLKTFSRQEKTIDTHYMDKILFNFATPENSYAFATFKEDKPIASTFFVYDKMTSHTVMGGYDHENKSSGLTTLTDWEGLHHAKNIGLNYFNFEGSMVPQIERYFRGFGGQLTPCYRINKAKIPIEILLKFFKREFF